MLALRDTTSRSGVAYDAAELLRAAGGLLRAEPELRELERRRLSCVYVDELADTDPAQLDLLELIAGDGADLVAFADPDSSIYSFRGADPGGVTGFPDRFHASTAYLTRAYRPGAELLRSTLRVAGRLRGPVRHRLLTAADPDAPPGRAEVHVFRSATSEAAYIAHRLRAAHLIGGVPWSRMAVVVRSTRLASASLQRALHQAGIPTTLHAEDLALSVHPAVTPLLRPIAAGWTRGAVKTVPPRWLPGPRELRAWTLAAGTPDADRYLLGLDPHAPDTHSPLASALMRVGIAPTLTGTRGARPALRISGRRRLSRLVENVGDPPEVAEALLFWPHV